MKITNQIFTSESVSEGHPDKMCDRISDAVLDAYISHDSLSRVACETMASHNAVHISAEVSSSHSMSYDEIKEIVKKVIYDTGYDEEWGYDPEKLKYIIEIDKQSSYIAKGVEKFGAGDQGIMFGYATSETPEFMPATYVYANRILLRLRELRKNGEIKNIGPDAKSQVSFLYDSNGKPEKITSIVLSTQHNKNVIDHNGDVIDEFKNEIIEKVIKPVCGNYIDDIDYKNIHINPTGSFLKGGPAADTGLTGRKIIVDTYGGRAPHGGGAFSGKDPTKVDRSAAYMARMVAKSLVSAGLCDECLIQLGYAIGVSQPVSVYVNSFQTAEVSDDIIKNTVIKNFDFSPKAIIELLELRKPIYYRTAAYGHFGRNEFKWESVKNIKE